MRLNSHAQLFFIFPFPKTPLCRLIVMTTIAVMPTLAPQQSCLLSCEVDTECDGRDAEAGERALEALEAGEGAGVSPLLAVNV